MNKIFISTGFFNNLEADKVCQNFIKYKINSFELSAGKYSSNLVKNIFKIRGSFNFKIHNYFPPSKIPFVINLASKKKLILKKSISHIFKSILFAKKLGCEIYTFHAGFRIDPLPKSLGKKLVFKTIQNRDVSMKIFINSVIKIYKFANKHNISLAIENNVITQKNYNKFGDNPFLLTNPKEIIFFVKKIKKKVGLLIDVGHLKVSSKTEGFSLKKALLDLNPFARGYHLSENNGIEDQNRPFTKKSWFFNLLRKDLQLYTIEVKTHSVATLKKQTLLLSRFLK